MGAFCIGRIDRSRDALLPPVIALLSDKSEWRPVKMRMRMQK